MKKITLTYALALLINIIAYSLSFYFFGYKTIIIFLLIWANNAERTYRDK